MTSAFKNSSVETVTVPESVILIYNWAFENCKKLKWVKILSKSNNVEFANIAFNNNNDNFKLLVYKNTKAEELAKKYNINYELIDGTVDSSKKNNGNTSQNNKKDDNSQNNSSAVNSGISKGKSEEQKKANNTNKNNYVSVDQTPPTISNFTHNPKTGKAKTVTVGWLAEDKGVGVAGYKISTKANEYSGNYTMYNKKYSKITGSYTFTSNGTYYLYVMDANGNVRCMKIEIKGVDTTAPYVDGLSFNPTTGWSKNVKVKWTAKDSGSGVVGWKIINKKEKTSNGFTKYDDKAYKSKPSEYVFTKNGTYYLYLIDKAGNISEPTQLNIKTIDETSPEVTKVTYTQGKGLVTVNWTATDKGLGIQYWKLSKKEKDWNGNYKNLNTAYSMKSGKIEISDNGTYFLYVQDVRGNSTSKKIVINNIDKTKPKINSLKVEIKNNLNYITYSAEDSGVGIKRWKLSTKADGSDGQFTNYTYEGKERNLAKVGKSINISKSGTYYLVLEDAVGWRTISDKIVVDAERPYIADINYVIGNGIKGLINDSSGYYLKKNGTIIIKLTFNEDIKKIDTTKIKLGSGCSYTYKKVSNKVYNIIITGNTDNTISKLNLEEGFAIDNAGNKSIVNKKFYKELPICVDDSVPYVNATYSSGGRIEATIKDLASGIKKYKFDVVDDDNKVVWTSEFKGSDKEPLNMKEITPSFNLNKYNGYKVQLYVEDMLGQSKTYTIYPKKASVEYVSKNGNVITYRIKTNYKSKIYDFYKNNINSFQTAKKCKIVDLVPEDTSGKKFLLTVNINGSTVDEEIIIPRGTIYASDPNDSSEVEIKFKVDVTKPVLGGFSTTKINSKNTKINFVLTDSGDSGIKTYKIEMGNKTLRTKTITPVNSYTDSITVNQKGTFKITIWDAHGNKTEATRTIS